MENLNNLINLVFEEAKKQENQRKEYISLVHNLIEGTERKERKSSPYGNDCVWRISFRLHLGIDGIISFSSEISDRENGLTSHDVRYLEEAYRNIDKCINYLLDIGTEYADAFIEHLAKVAIPLFLQGRHPKDYYVRKYNI